MANIEISHDKPTIGLHPIKWSAAIWASVIGGLVFAALEVLMVPLFQGKSHGSVSSLTLCRADCGPTSTRSLLAAR